MSQSAEIVRILKQAALFKNFTDTGLQIIASIAVEKHFPPGTPIFVENMIGDGLYIVADGNIRLSMRDDHGQDVALTTIGPGASLGEAAVLRAGPRLCSATAETPARVVEISRRDLAMLQRSKPQACLKLMMGVVERIGEGVRGTQADLRKMIGG